MCWRRLGWATGLPSIDRLLEGQGARSGVFITAWNPRSQPVPRSETKPRISGSSRSSADAAFGSWRISAWGHPAWEPEQGMFALDLSLAHALELAVAFGQNAIVKVEHGQPAELVATD